MEIDASRIKDVVTGILVIIGIVGSLYSNLAPEDEARWTFSTLAPDIDLALEQSDDNTGLILEQERRIVRLEEKAAILQRLLIGQLSAQGIVDKGTSLSEPLDLDKIHQEVEDEMEGSLPKKPGSNTPQRPAPKPKRRARPKAPWLQQAE